MSDTEIKQDLNLLGSGDACDGSNHQINNEKIRTRHSIPSVKKFIAKPSSDQNFQYILRDESKEIEKNQSLIEEPTEKRFPFTPIKKSVSMPEIKSTTKTESFGLQQKESKVDTNVLEKVNIMIYNRERLLLAKVMSTILHRVWDKKKQQVVELTKEVKDLKMQNSLLNNLRARESKKRDELSKAYEKLRKEHSDLENDFQRTKNECELLSASLHHTEKQCNQFKLDAEKSEYLRNKVINENAEYLEHLRKTNEELMYLRTESKEQKKKISYMNNVADQQDINLKQLNKIAEELDAQLKEKAEIVTVAMRKHDEAVESEKQVQYNLKILEQQLREFTEVVRKSKLEIFHWKEAATETEQQKLEITLENVDLKHKLQKLEEKLKTMQEEIEKERAIIKENNRKMWFLVAKYIYKVPWNFVLLHCSIFLLPAVSRFCIKNF